MSERTHSPNPAPRKRKLFPVMIGTAGAFVLAVIGLQFLRPEPAASQTRAPARQAAGTARVETEAAASHQGETLARVNNQNISWEVVARECMDRHGKDVLEEMISRLLIHQACQERGITVSEEEIGQQVNEFARAMKVPTETFYQLMQSRNGLTPAQYHTQIIWPMLALKKLAGSDVQISEEELQRAFVRDYGPRVEARMILVDGNIRQATKVWDQAKADPENFARLAGEVSAEPNSRALGGQIPPIRRYASPANSSQAKIEEQAFNMQPGEISPVMQLDDKFIILRCERQTAPLATDIEQVRADLTEQIRDEKVQEAVGQVFMAIKEKAQIHNYLTGESTTGTAGGVVQQTGAAEQRPQGARSAAGQRASVPQ